MEEDGLDMVTNRLVVCVAFWFPLIIFSHTFVSADVYRYQDENGVWHFTNIRKDARYKLFFRTYPTNPARFTKKYEWIIKQASAQYGVDPSLVKAVIKAESDFDYKAVSHKGAQGLMQLMPETAVDMAVKDPFDPQENIYGGTRYLSLLLERFKENISLALAAYNAGPDSVEDYKGIPPYSETITYIKRVLEYYKKYQSGLK